jgi:3'(2'), 5'-bisphosphate nucleotidase
MVAKLQFNSLAGIALNAAVAGGREVMTVYRQDDFKIQIKADVSPVTIADINSQQAIIEHLIVSNVPVLSEEGDEIPYHIRKDWQQLWVVDPLDGTKEFIARNGEFAINIALVNGHQPILGIILNPVEGTVYIGEPEVGLMVLKLPDDWADSDCQYEISELEVLANIKEPSHFTAVVSKSHFNASTNWFMNKAIEQFGSVHTIHIGSALKQCLVARGAAHFYPRIGPTMEWDTAAGHALVKSVGGNILVYPDYQELTYNRENLTNPSFICYNGSLKSLQFVKSLI